MKIVACKFVNEENLERQMEKLVSKACQTRYAILCADKLVCDRLRSIGLSSDSINYVEDFEIWHVSHKLIERWKTILKGHSYSTYLGVDVLEFDPPSFAFTLKTMSLCVELAKRGNQVVFVVLNKYFNWMFPTLNTTSIATVCYGPRLRKPRALLRKLHEYLRWSVLTIQRGESFPARNSENRNKGLGLCLVTASPTERGNVTDYYLKPGMSILKECHKMGVSFRCVIDTRAMGEMLQEQRLDYEVVSGPKLKDLPRFVFSVMLRFIGLRKFLAKAAFGDDSLKLTLPLLLQGLFSNCYRSITRIDFFDSLIASLSPKIVLAIPDRGRMGRIGIEVARKYGVPSLTVQAGLIDEHPDNGFLVADKVAVMGEQARRIYLSRGVDSKKVVVTGMAHWDNLFNRDKHRDLEELRKHGINPNKRIVVFATENIPVAETGRMIEGTASEILRLDHTVLVVKVHPREDLDIYRKMVEIYTPDKVVVTRDIDLHSLLNACEVLVDGFSNVTLEAMMIGRPVISITLSERANSLFRAFEQYKAALVVRRYEDIPSALVTALSDKRALAELDQGRKNYVMEYAYRTDGRASYRIAKLISSMIR